MKIKCDHLYVVHSAQLLINIENIASMSNNIVIVYIIIKRMQCYFSELLAYYIYNFIGELCAFLCYCFVKSFGTSFGHSTWHIFIRTEEINMYLYLSVIYFFLTKEIIIAKMNRKMEY